MPKNIIDESDRSSGQRQKRSIDDSFKFKPQTFSPCRPYLQVSFQLKPKIAATECRMRLPKRMPVAVLEESSSEEESDSDVDIELSESDDEEYYSSSEEETSDTQDEGSPKLE